MKKGFTKLVGALSLGFILAACGTAAEGNEAGTGSGNANGTSANTAPITIVLYPNESGSEFALVHEDMERFIYEATGRPGNVMLTTDYNIAIESIANGTADLAFMGPTGYIIASNQNPNVRAILVPSGPSGTLEDAVYYSFLAVREEDGHLWEDGQGGYDLSLLEGESMSFVALTSTSGFVVPSIGLNSLGFLPEGTLPEDHFGQAGPFFSQVLMGQSHQGSAFNLVSGQTNVAAFFNNDSVFEHHSGPYNRAGMVYAIRQDAEAPLDTVRGELMRIILSISVPNAPFVANMDNLTEEEVESIIEVFMSDEVTFSENWWGTDQETIAFNRIRQGDERYLRVPDNFFDDLR
ncbi:MAG: phosphate/phosphite/phosphonate ABC transporter substrate-binding protein [Turicibacter sp.]|nr:phosphate/phosphite/phosphonate ABC transporter substrate-binding protein [Turicibacter sp.]